MLRRSLPVALLALAPLASGCGADAREDAPEVATGVVIAQAPPNAVGADVGRPPAGKPLATSTAPTSIKQPAKPPPAPLPMDPLAPTPTTIAHPPKGTEL